MLSGDGRFEVVFNGEIYNYRELRTELQAGGYVFRSDSDTEVLLNAWARWGETALRKFSGMFAFAIYDRDRQTIVCARDAFGIKPFFYSMEGGGLLFASTLQAVGDLRGGQREANWQRGYDFLVHGDYDSNGDTFLRGVNQLQPGHLLEIELSGQKQPRITRWWPPEVREDRTLSFQDAAALVRDEFLSNVRLHLRSDVSIGAALSGGIDSSAVVCAMRQVEPDLPINTFSYIAAGTPLCEESWVDLINTKVGAVSHKVSASSDALLADLDDMVLAQGEPFGSTSIYAQYQVFRLAREHGVTVTLDGQGADELIAGYSGYPGYRLLSLIETGDWFAAGRFVRAWSRWPGRDAVRAGMELGRIVLPDSIYSHARHALGRNFTPPWLKPGLLAEAGVDFREERPSRNASWRGRRVNEQLLTSLMFRGLPALLRHADRNSMRFSVESRVPFLTPALAELLLSLPERYLISDAGETKSVFRAAMRGIVPDAVLDRKDKIGFATPEKQWLLAIASTLREYIVADAGRIPFIDEKRLLTAFDAMVGGKAPFSWQLWRWVNYVRWFKLNRVVE